MASRFAEIRELEKEEKRKERENMRVSKQDTEKLFGKNWRTNPEALRKIQESVQKARAEQKARRDAEIAKAREDMASGKTSTLVGKGGDPYAGIEGPLPMYKDQKAADTAKQKQSRYLLDEPMQYRPAKEYVGKSKEETEELIEKGVPLGGYESTEGKGVEVRKAIGTRQVFKAMVVGDPTQDKVFDKKEDAEAYLKQTGQQGAVAGVRVSGTPQEMESAAAKYKARAEEGRKAMVEEKERPEKERKRVDAAIDRAWATRYERASQQYGREMDPNKIYANELAKRGLRNPMEATSPQERRQIEEENSRERMGDFRFAIGAKERAARAERELVSQYRDFKEEAKQARKEKRFANAAALEEKAFELNEKVGGNIQSVTNRRKILEQNEMDIVREELQKRANLRIKAREKQTTANPEAASYDREDFTPKSTAAPIGVGTESLEYGQRPNRADATQQPFGMVPPQTIDRGVDFGALSEANVSGSTIAPTTSPRPTPESTTAAPTAPKAKTSKEVTQEDIQPGISEVRMPPRAEGESVAAYNKRANEEYEKQVILPSFDEDTREALLTARQLNSELEKFRGVWLVPQNRPRIKKIKSDLEKPKEALKNKIKGLRTELRKAPGLQSPEAKFIRFQIETLKNELGIIDKFLI